MPRPVSTFSDDVQRVSAARHEPLESPIDLCVGEAIPLLLPNLEWMHLNRVPSRLRVANTGRTVIMSPRWSSGGPRVRGGPLKSEYILSQIHFHWGRSDDEGSEHSVEGQRLPLEMHVVGYNAAYESHHIALDELDGTVVIAFFFVLQEPDNPDLSELMPAMERVCAEGTSTRHPTFALSRLLPALRSDYLIYWGTVSGRDVSHQLLWLVDRKPIAISKQQISVFRRIHKDESNGPDSYPAPAPPPGAVFYADPTRRPPDTPTLLPLGPETPARGSPRVRLSPRASPQSSAKASLMSNQFPTCGETPLEQGTPRQQDSYEIYKAMAWDQEEYRLSSRRPAEKPFSEPTAVPVPVAFSFGCRRGGRTDREDPQPYMPGRNVSFKHIDKVQHPNRREAAETSRTGYALSDSSESASANTKYNTARTSMRRRSRPVEKRKREQSSSRAASPASNHVSSGLSARHTENHARNSHASSVSSRRRADVDSPPWSNESLSPSVELASSDLSAPAPARPHERRTQPSIINTCGIEDIIIETLPPTSAPLPKHSDVSKRPPEVVAVVSSRGSRGSRGSRALSRDHPNTQPLMDKSMTGASVAGSFAQEELARRDLEGGRGSGWF